MQDEERGRAEGRDLDLSEAGDGQDVYGGRALTPSEIEALREAEQSPLVLDLIATAEDLFEQVHRALEEKGALLDELRPLRKELAWDSRVRALSWEEFDERRNEAWTNPELVPDFLLVLFQTIEVLHQRLDQRERDGSKRGRTYNAAEPAPDGYRALVLSRETLDAIVEGPRPTRQVLDLLATVAEKEAIADAAWAAAEERKEEIVRLEEVRRVLQAENKALDDATRGRLTHLGLDGDPAHTSRVYGRWILACLVPFAIASLLLHWRARVAPLPPTFSSPASVDQADDLHGSAGELVHFDPCGCEPGEECPVR